MKKKIFIPVVFVLLAQLFLMCQKPSSQQGAFPVLKIEAEMETPAWALEERKLFALYDTASRVFAGKYLADNGYFKIVERWGGNDGADDAMENFSHWPLVYALGGPQVLLDLYNKAWEGHLIQFTNAKIPSIEMAKDGMYYKEFITSFDWEHNGEGLSAFNFYSLVNPNDTLYKKRMQRFAGFYMNEDPEAPNYDPEHKIIRSLHNGSRGPKLSFATETDWGGEPIEGEPERQTRYSTAGNIVGDHPLNLLTSTLATNAYMLTGDEKYKNWVLEYVGAWRDRILENGGNIPSNIGLDGTIGGEWDGKWYGGTFGWNFWPESNVRNYSVRGVRVGLGNALMLSGDLGYAQPLRMQMANLYAAKKMDGSRILLPNKYGDDGWYGYIPEIYKNELYDIYLWSMADSDLEHINTDPWISFLLGDNPGYPEKALKREQNYIVSCIQKITDDSSQQSSRKSDEPQDVNPVQAGTLVQLTTGGNNPGIAGNILHCRVRYFDPVLKRAGLPADVAALVDKITAEGIELTLVNTNPDQAKKVILQAGAYGEHQFTEVILDGKQININNKNMEVDLAKGAGSKLSIKINLHVNTPSLALPW